MNPIVLFVFTGLIKEHTKYIPSIELFINFIVILSNFYRITKKSICDVIFVGVQSFSLIVIIKSIEEHVRIKHFDNDAKVH